MTAPSTSISNFVDLVDLCRVGQSMDRDAPPISQSQSSPAIPHEARRSVAESILGRRQLAPQVTTSARRNSARSLDLSRIRRAALIAFSVPRNIYVPPGLILGWRKIVGLRLDHRIVCRTENDARPALHDRDHVDTGGVRRTISYLFSTVRSMAAVQSCSLPIARVFFSKAYAKSYPMMPAQAKPSGVAASTMPTIGRNFFELDSTTPPK